MWVGVYAMLYLCFVHVRMCVCLYSQLRLRGTTAPPPPLQFARHVHVVQEDSPYFALQSPKQAGAAGKVAPGMEVTYTVVFTPDDTKVSVSVV